MIKEETLTSVCYRVGMRVVTSRLGILALILGVIWVFGFLLLSENPSWTEKVLPRENYGSEIEWVMADRRARYERVCRSQTVPGEVMEIYYHKPTRLAVCHVPKVGCTFWKRMFHFLYNETGGPVSSPFEIDRHYVHFAPREKVQVMSGYSTTWFYSWTKTMISTFYRVLFSRDPYERLWSVYVDKFVLPDSWLDYGLDMLKQRKGKSNKTCADDITFPEFLTYALNFKFDVHWKPIHKVCNPCAFHPQYVGKMETFSRDSSHVLHVAGLGHLVQGHRDHKQYMEDEVRMLTTYIFQLYAEREGLRRCMRHSDLVDRLWRAFVLNGYIAANVSFPKQKISSETDDLPTQQALPKAMALLLTAHRQGPILTSKQMKSHRRQIMVQNYKAAPPELLNKIVSSYSDDFILFDYDPRPADIFGKEPVTVRV